MRTKARHLDGPFRIPGGELVVPRPPIDPAVRDAVIAEFATDKARNAIAREHGVSVGTVTKLAQEAEHEFDRSVTKKATAAKQADHKAVLADLAGSSARIAGNLFASLEKMTPAQWAKVSPYSRGVIAGIMADKARELAPEDSAAEEISSLLGGLLGSLKAKHGDAPSE